MRFKAVAKYNQTTPLFAKIKITGLLTGVEAKRLGRGQLPCEMEIGEIDGVYLNVASAFCRALERSNVRLRPLVRTCYDAMLAITKKHPANGSYIVEPLKKGGIMPMPRTKTKKAKKKKR